jgi:serine/threonine-protein kinase
MPAAVKPEDEIEPSLAPGQELVDESSNERYQVLDLVGRGGMGEVYSAVRQSDGAHCAVKCVRGDLVSSPTVVLRTRFEALAFRKISHPNVVRVHGTGILRGRVPWMCMDWLEGFTLAEIIEKKGKIPIRWAVEIVRDLCRGLHAIHPYAIHRDIKPSNVHFGLDAVTRALDLGAAKSNEANVHLTSTGFQVGTVPFMAPEQLDNTIPVDHRADIWAVTVVLYILMTGVHPLAVNGALPASKFKLGLRILTEPHRPLLDALPSAPPVLGDIINRGLAKEPDDRPRTAEEFAMVLTAVLAMLEAEAAHAEPVKSLLTLMGATPSRIVAPPPPILWIPPRTTEIMPPPVARKAEVVQFARTLPRTTEPMLAPVDVHVAKTPPRVTAPMPAPVQTRGAQVADPEPPPRESAVVRKETRLLKQSDQPTGPEAQRPRPTESTDRDTELPPESLLVGWHSPGLAKDTLERPRIPPPPRPSPVEVAPARTEPTSVAERAASPLPMRPARAATARPLTQIALFLGVVAGTVGGGLGVLHALGPTRAVVSAAPSASAETPIATAPERPSSEASASPPPAPSASPPPAPSASPPPAPSASASSPTPSPSTLPPPPPVVSGTAATPRPPTTAPRRAPSRSLPFPEPF